MVPETQRKLREAQFFYRHLLDERQQTVRHNAEAFGYYYSAFLSAARSVPWVLQNEEPEKYRAWRSGWEAQLGPEDRKLLKLTNELRIAETKRDGAKPIVELEAIPIAQILGARPEHHPSRTMQLGTPATLTGVVPPGVPEAKVGRWVHYVEDEDGRTEVTAMCKRYLDYLEKLVQEFLAAHAENDRSS